MRGEKWATKLKKSLTAAQCKLTDGDRDDDELKMKESKAEKVIRDARVQRDDSHSKLQE